MTASSAQMVGRAAELEAMLDAVGDSRGGTPRAVLVRGEAGIGKTRLVAEMVARARADDPGLVVATGQCIEAGEVAAPFTAIRRLLRELRDAVGEDELRAAAGSSVVVATLATLLPELSTDADAPSGRGDYVAEAIERVIERLSLDHRLLLVLEDLHWADRATLDVLRTLAMTLRGTHVTVVMTYRTDDVDRGHPLRPVLVELDRSRLVIGLELHRLTPQQVAEQAAQIAAALDTDELERVVNRSQGVPFFVEELLALDRATLPATLRGLVLARHERLSGTARDVVGAVAAGGVHVDHDMLAEVYPGEIDTLTSGLKEALAANVLVSDEAGYAFRHALIQEAVHDELLPSERAVLHRAYATAADARTRAGDPSFAALAAEHWLQARDLPRAFEAIVAAKRHAQQSFAYGAAAGLGERLLEIWDQVPDAAESAGTSAASLHLELARLGVAHDPGRAGRVARAGLRAEPTLVERAALLAELAVALGNQSKYRESLPVVDEAVALLDEDDPTHWQPLARVLALRSTLPVSMIGGSEARQLAADRAVALAERLGDAASMKLVLTNSCWGQIDSGELEDALQTVRRMDDYDMSPPDRLHAIVIELDILVRLGRFQSAIDVAIGGYEESVRVGLERGLGAMILPNLAEAYLGLGDAAGAREVLGKCLPLLSTQPLFRSFALRLLALCDTWEGDHEAAAAIRRREAAVLAELGQEDPEERIGWAELDGELALNQLGDVEERGARLDLVAEALRACATLAEDDFLEGPGTSRRVLPGALRAYAEAALAEVDTEDVALVRIAVETSVDSQPDDGPGRALRALAGAELARAAGSVDPTPWRHVVDHSDLDTLPARHRHYARYRLAAALAASGEPAEATSELVRVREEAAAGGAAVVARWARALEHRVGGRDAGGPELGLTARERQVLALVSQGLTNRQIGERLFISHKTASVHVSAILAKVGARSRTEAAAIYAGGAGQDLPD